MNIFKSIWEAIFGKKRNDRDYYDRSKGKASRWDKSLVLVYFHSSVNSRLRNIYIRAISEWAEAAKLALTFTDKIDESDIVLRGWVDFLKGTENNFAYTDIRNRGDQYPGTRFHAEIMLNTLRQNEDDETVYKVILHELGHAFAWDGESGQSISDNRDDIMHSPTFAKHLSDADKRSMRKAYGK